jgi:hypothetical protein
VKPTKTVIKYLGEIGRKGGHASTQAKAEAARRNGKLGGRPTTKETLKQSEQ